MTTTTTTPKTLLAALREQAAESAGLWLAQATKNARSRELALARLVREAEYTRGMWADIARGARQLGAPGADDARRFSALAGLELQIARRWQAEYYANPRARARK